MPGMKSWFDVSVLNWFSGELTRSTSGIIFVRRSRTFQALRLSTFEIEAIDYLDKRRNDPEVNRSMDFRPGDLLYLHNDRGVAFADRF
jgi:hypothetical protein